MIAFHFPPSASAGTHRSRRFAKYLQAHAWKISVLTADPYPGSVDSGLRTPEGVSVYRSRVFRGLAALIRTRNSLIGKNGDGPVAAPSGEKAFKKAKPTYYWRRIKDTLSLLMTFPDAEIGWFPSAVLKGWRIIRNGKIDLLYTSGPPHSSHLIGWALKRLTAKPWIADFRDPWARKPWLQEHEKQRWRQRGIERLERWMVGAADKVILNTDRMEKDFALHYPGEPKEKFASIPNGFDPEEFQGLSPKRAEGPFRITHAGTLYRKRNPLVLLQAVQRLIGENVLSEKEIRLDFIGSVLLGDFSLEEKAKDLGLQDVIRRIPHLPHRECLSMMYASDVLLVVQPETDTQIPGKIFEYLYIGKPVLALAHAGMTADFILSNRLGYVADPDRLEEVIKAVRLSYEDHLRGRKTSGATEDLKTGYDIRTLTRGLDAVLSGCISKKESGIHDRNDHER